MKAVGWTEKKWRENMPKHWIWENSAPGEGVEGAAAERNGLPEGLKDVRRPTACKTWMSNTQCVLQEFLSTWSPADSSGTEPDNYSPCRAKAPL